MKIRIGTSGYSYKEWKGSFYPKDQKPAGMLRFYASKLGTVEINSTFYRMPLEKVVAAWADETPQAFSFVLKAPQRITHQLRLKKECADSLASFLKAATELGRKRGPLLFQLPPNFKKDLPRLVAFLAMVPRRLRVAFEFRHASWFDDEVYAALKKRAVALCTVDTEEGETPLVPTAKWGYFRLRDKKYTKRQLGAWAKRIRAQPWDEAYIFFKHEDEGTGPRFAAELERSFAAQK